MTHNEIKAHIDGESYADLLRRWRYAAAGHPFFIGEIGQYYEKVMNEKREALAPGLAVAISKGLG